MHARVDADLEHHQDASQTEAFSDHLLAIIKAQTEIARAARDPLTLMNLVVQHARSLTGADGAAVGVVDGDHLKFNATSGLQVPHGIEVPIAGSLSGECLRSGRLLISDDTQLDARVDRNSTRVTNARSAAVAPLFDGDLPVGVLSVTSQRPRAFSGRAAQTLQLMSGLLGAALGHALGRRRDCRHDLDKPIDEHVVDCQRPHKLG
jgi:two-component system NtrC family sensor kinase